MGFRSLSTYRERLVIIFCSSFEMDEHRLSNMVILHLLEPAYGHLINKDELVLRNDAEIIAAVALGKPEEFPTLTDDPEECKKLVTDYFRRLHGVALYNLSVKPRLAREATSLPPNTNGEANPNGEGAKASAGSDELMS